MHFSAFAQFARIARMTSNCRWFQSRCAFNCKNGSDHATGADKAGGRQRFFGMKVGSWNVNCLYLSIQVLVASILQLFLHFLINFALSLSLQLHQLHSLDYVSARSLPDLMGYLHSWKYFSLLYERFLRNFVLLNRSMSTITKHINFYCTALVLLFLFASLEFSTAKFLALSACVKSLSFVPFWNVINFR